MWLVLWHLRFQFPLYLDVWNRAVFASSNICILWFLPNLWSVFFERGMNLCECRSVKVPRSREKRTHTVASFWVFVVGKRITNNLFLVTLEGSYSNVFRAITICYHREKASWAFQRLCIGIWSLKSMLPTTRCLHPRTISSRCQGSFSCYSMQNGHPPHLER